MIRELVISASPYETRVAALEDGRATEIAVERQRQRGVVGNIYKGRVTKVLPGMQAAFVDVGFEKDAFLYVDDVREEDWEDFEDLAGEELRTSDASIDDLLKEGQEVLVQVIKDPMAGKGARLTTNVSLPGRFLVYTPFHPHIGISHRIADKQERDRLKAIFDRLRVGDGSFIARTAAEGRSEEDFLPDRDALLTLWGSLRNKAERTSAPALLHEELDLLIRSARDILADDFAAIWIDDEEGYRRIVAFLEQVQPRLVSRVRLYRKSMPIFEDFGLESEIERTIRSRVWLPSGGYIVINPTEALVAIDVNTGKFVGKSRLEDTVFTTNLEAVREIVRQIRLRDLGGIIVVDLIDMAEEGHRQELFEAFEEELRKDRSRTKILKISEFGLLEITRKRSRQSLDRALTRPCPTCGGGGRVKSELTVALEIRREIQKLAGKLERGETVLVRAHPNVGRLLQQEEREMVEDLEREHGIRVTVEEDPGLHPASYEIAPA